MADEDIVSARGHVGVDSSSMVVRWAWPYWLVGGCAIALAVILLLCGIDVAISAALGVITLLMGWLGWRVSISPPKPDTAANLNRTFLALALIGIVLVVVQAVRANTAQQKLESLTGGDSYAYVVPQMHAQMVPPPLVIHNAGSDMLLGVSLTIHKASDFENSVAFFNAPEFTIGVLYPKQFKVLKTSIDPQPDADGIARYVIMISAQNGETWENLHFRKGRYAANGYPWAYRLNVSKIEIVGPNETQTRPVLDRPIWSDDAGEGRPVKTP